MAAMNAVEDDPQAPTVQCWGCGEEGHTKRECPNKPPPSQPPVPRGGQVAGREVEVARARVNQPHHLPYHVQAQRAQV